MEKFKEIYERFINLALAAESLSDTHKLGPVEKRFLAILASAWSKGEQVSVVKSTNLLQEVSTMTAFRYIKGLRKKGYLELVVDNADNRVKYVTPTALCNKYFQDVGKMIFEAAESK